MADQRETVGESSEWFRRVSARRALFRPLCAMFPEVDSRIINATILEHGSDMSACVESIRNEMMVELTGAPTPSTPSTSAPEASRGIAVELAASHPTQVVVPGLVQPITEQATEKEPTDKVAAKVSSLWEYLLGPSHRSENIEPLCTDTGLSIENVSRLGQTTVTAGAVADAMESTGDILSTKPPCEGAGLCDVEEARHSLPEQSDVEEAYTESDLFSDPEHLDSEDDDEAGRLSSSSFEDAERHDSGNNDIKDDCSESDDVVGSQLTRDENYSSVYTDVEGTSSSEYAMCGSMQSSSSQAPTIEVLDEKVQQARNDKDDLIGALAEVRALQLEVERAGASARQAKVDAANAGAEILAKAKEVREQTAIALQANEVHHGEVFGEKAVLATEARELQARLLQDTEKKTKTANNIRQIKAILQGLLDKAVEEKEAADVLKLANETAAQNALALEEGLLENVVLESEQLEREAEDCKKLREFLIESGSVVDSLQGEVAILCEDVEVLKRQVEALALSASSGYVPQANMSVRATRGGSHSTSSKSSTNHGVQMIGVEHLSGEPAETPLVPAAGSVSGSSSTAAESGNELPKSLDHEIKHTNVEEGRIEEFVGTELMSRPCGGLAEDSETQVILPHGQERTTLCRGNEYVNSSSNLLDDKESSPWDDQNSWHLVDPGYIGTSGM